MVDISENEFYVKAKNVVGQCKVLRWIKIWVVCNLLHPLFDGFASKDY